MQDPIAVFITTAGFNVGLTLTQAAEPVLPFLMATHRGGHAERSSPAEAQGPEGPTAGQWRGGQGATGANWPQGIDSHISGTSPSAAGGWECIMHLRDDYRKRDETLLTLLSLC